MVGASSPATSQHALWLLRANYLQQHSGDGWYRAVRALSAPPMTISTLYVAPRARSQARQPARCWSPTRTQAGNWSGRIDSNGNYVELCCTYPHLEPSTVHAVNAAQSALPNVCTHFVSDHRQPQPVVNIVDWFTQARAPTVTSPHVDGCSSRTTNRRLPRHLPAMITMRCFRRMRTVYVAPTGITDTQVAKFSCRGAVAAAHYSKNSSTVEVPKWSHWYLR